VKFPNSGSSSTAPLFHWARFYKRSAFLDGKIRLARGPRGHILTIVASSHCRAPVKYGKAQKFVTVQRERRRAKKMEGEWEMSICGLSELVKKNGLRCPPSPGKTACQVTISWLILAVVICLSQKILAYMILSVQENEVENSNGSSNERRTLA
jgi:hypothetical protein